MPNKRVTIHDVARLAGVSHTTVSWVVHDDKRISHATKAKVQRAIAELKYHPNQVARSLVRGASNTIALMSSFYSTIFELSVLRGIETALEELGSNFSVIQFTTRNNPVKRLEILEQIIYGRRADALICLNTDVDSEIVHDYVRGNVPLILVEAYNPALHSVCDDSYLGARLAVEHLVARGRRRIAFIGGFPADKRTSWSADERLRAYKNVLSEHDLPYDPGLVYSISSYYINDGKAILPQLMHNKVDGVFCAGGDLVAMGVMAAAREAGIHVPRDLSVVGYDNLQTSALVNPPLTSVSQPIGLMGREAIQICMEALANPDLEPQHRIFKPELLVRESS